MSTLPDVDYYSRGKGYFEGGWGFIESAGGTLVELPVLLPPIGLGAVLSGTDTWLMRCGTENEIRVKREYQGLQTSNQVRVQFTCAGDLETVVVGEATGPMEPAPITRELYKLTQSSKGQGGSFMVQPNNSHEVRKVNGNDYLAAWYRGGMPRTTGMHQHTITLDGLTTVTPTETELYPSQTAFWGVVPGGGHAMEDTLHKPTYAKSSAFVTETEIINYQAIGTGGGFLCPPSWATHPGCPPGNLPGFTCEAIWPAIPDGSSRTEGDSWVFPYRVQDIAGSGSNPQMAGYMWHSVDWVRYLNYWAHPLWSYFLAWSNWNLLGSPTGHRDYWQTVRSQWMGDSFLPPGERTQTRNHIALDCLWKESGMSPFWDAFTGGFGWIGASRWQTRKVTALSEFQYTNGQAALWTDEDCAIAHGADLVVTLDPGKTIGKIKLKLGDLNVAPYEWPHIANEVFLDWELTNVLRIRAYFVGFDGTKSELLKRNPTDTDTKRGFRYRRPEKFTSRYAGSWAIDNGALVLPDTGSDATPLGLSSTIMGDEERIAAFGLNIGRGAVALLLEIEPVNPAAAVTLHYPKLYLASQADPLLVRESGHVASIVQKNGAGIRCGNQSFTAGNAILPTPFVFGQGDVMNIVDAICYSKTYIEGVQHSSGVVAELSARYDAYEGQSVAQASNFGLGVLLPTFSGGWRFALVNTINNVPPLQCFPHHDRDTNLDAIADEFTNDVWSYAQGPLYLVYNSPVRMFLRRRSGSAITAPASAIEGWKLEKGSPAVTNAESIADYEVVEGSVLRARTRPWRGYFALGVNADVGLDLAKDVAYHVSPAGRHLVAIVDLNDAVRFAFCNNVPIPLAPVFRDAGISGASRIAVHFDSADQEEPFLWVVGLDGSLKQYRSRDEATWTDMAVLAHAGAVDVAGFIDDNGTSYVYYSTVDKKLRGQVVDRMGTVISSFVIVASDVKGPLSHYESPGDDSDNWRIVLWYIRESDSAVIQLTSPDGEHFS